MSRKVVTLFLLAVALVAQPSLAARELKVVAPDDGEYTPGVFYMTGPTNGSGDESPTPSDGGTSGCAAVLCPVDTTCVVSTFGPKCLKEGEVVVVSMPVPDVCATVDCKDGYCCVPDPKTGEASCVDCDTIAVPINDDVCAAVRCAENKCCTPGSDGLATCIDCLILEATKGPGNTTDGRVYKGSPICKPSCKSGQTCKADSKTKKNVCVAKTLTVPTCKPACKSGRTCKADAKTKKNVCVATTPAVPTCKPTCKAGFTCKADTKTKKNVCVATTPNCVKKCKVSERCAFDAKMKSVCQAKPCTLACVKSKTCKFDAKGKMFCAAVPAKPITSKSVKP